MRSRGCRLDATRRGRLFVATVAWGALVALAWFPVAQLVAPRVGARTAFVLLVAVALAGHVAQLASGSRRRVGLALVAFVGVVAAGALSSGVGAPVVVAAAGLALVRSGLLFRREPARAALVELLLAGGGLVLARWLGGPGPAGVALALWAFSLVQSAFFLVGGAVRTEPRRLERDAWTDARERLRRLLDEPA